jgi:hypothetical protein
MNAAKTIKTRVLFDATLTRRPSLRSFGRGLDASQAYPAPTDDDDRGWYLSDAECDRLADEAATYDRMERGAY